MRMSALAMLAHTSRAPTSTWTPRTLTSRPDTAPCAVCSALFAGHEHSDREQPCASAPGRPRRWGLSVPSAQRSDLACVPSTPSRACWCCAPSPVRPSRWPGASGSSSLLTGRRAQARPGQRCAGTLAGPGQAAAEPRGRLADGALLSRRRYLPGRDRRRLEGVSPSQDRGPVTDYRQ